MLRLSMLSERAPLLGALALLAALAACSPVGPAVPEFGSLAESSWVNGAPMSFAQARGSVVLVEAWDPT